MSNSNLKVNIDWMKLGEMVFQKATEGLGECQIIDCGNRSIGLVCGSCSKRACLHHVYIKPSVPPSPLCVVCVLDSHPEVLEDE